MVLRNRPTLTIGTERLTYLNSPLACNWGPSPSTWQVPGSSPGPGGRAACAFFLHPPFLPPSGDSFFSHLPHQPHKSVRVKRMRCFIFEWWYGRAKKKKKKNVKMVTYMEETHCGIVIILKVYFTGEDVYLQWSLKKRSAQFSAKKTSLMLLSHLTSLFPLLGKQTNKYFKKDHHCFTIRNTYI